MGQSQDQLPKSWNLYTLLYIMNSLKKTTTFLLEEKKVSKSYTFFYIRFQTETYRFFVFWTIRVIPLLKKRHLFVIFSMLCLKSFTSKTLFTKKSLFHINGIHFLFQKTQNTLQSNRLSRQKGLPTLSMARSALKIHENFLF